ncbi:MAG TPA: alpha/beta hydrolase-fold protein [Anaerohalosphaeraceae bacterium]|nr:alpha/beta hydrolase-fold protein [Anaerohalosphaeraceae bacterium]
MVTRLSCAILTGFITFSLLGGGNCLAQSDSQLIPEDFKPASSNQPGRLYPQVNSEGRVRAQITAPDAKHVFLDIGGKKYPLTKKEDGSWMGQSDPQDEGFHYYQIIVNGAQVPDPGSMYFYGAGRWGSGIEIPARDQDFYALKNVPHGQLCEHLYFSKITNAWRRCFVYLPPDYYKDGSMRYPVLYLQHGSFEDETGWGAQGKANLILDNLIAEKKAVPMIIVMDNGYASVPGSNDSGGNRVARGTSAFEDVMIREIIPMIDGHYRTLADREHRAMAGLSMGANQTIRITMNNLDTFSHIGGFSGTSNYPDTAPLDPETFMSGKFKDGQALNKQIKLFWLGLGTKEPAPFPGSVGAFRAMLDKVGMKYVYYESPATAHEWQTWRRSLYQFAPLLFSDLKTQSAGPAETDGLRIYSAGHSLHWYVPDILAELASASGIKGHKTAGVQSLGVSRTLQHWNHQNGRNQARQALEAGDVDVLTLSPIQFPDEGIENFVKLGLEHNPNMTFTVQISWGGPDIDNQDFDFSLLMSRPDREKTPEQLKVLNQKNEIAAQDQAAKINEQVGRQVVLLVPTSQALTALRTMIYNKQIPGLDKQAELFADNIGHPTAPLQALNAYLHFAVIYGRSPAGLPIPSVLKNAGKPQWNNEAFNRALAELAWTTVMNYPPSGVKAPTQ